jgi:hypothetical protein
MSNPPLAPPRGHNRFGFFLIFHGFIGARKILRAFRVVPATIFVLRREVRVPLRAARFWFQFARRLKGTILMNAS